MSTVQVTRGGLCCSSSSPSISSCGAGRARWQRCASRAAPRSAVPFSSPQSHRPAPLSPASESSATASPPTKERRPTFLSRSLELALAASIISAPFPGAAMATLAATEPADFNSSTVIFDPARVIPSGSKRQLLAEQLAELEAASGFRLRVVTTYGKDGRLSDTQLRQALKLTPSTVVVQADPSNPNLLRTLYIGDEVLAKLHNPFWQELEARYGNLFYVRDYGEAVALTTALTTVATCLAAPEGCSVVPGLPTEQYQFTLLLSVVAGMIVGFVSYIEPQGFIQRRWVWTLVFAPLWGPILVNFGLAPILTRTSDLGPVLANCGAFLAAALAIGIGPKALLGAGKAPEP